MHVQFVERKTIFCLSCLPQRLSGRAVSALPIRPWSSTPRRPGHTARPDLQQAPNASELKREPPGARVTGAVSALVSQDFEDVDLSMGAMGA